LAVVTGWRSEIFPESSIYNAICDQEWHRPAGPIIACGGDMMVRRAAFEEVGGFDDRVIAAEDDEFCLRIGAAGWKLLRLPLNMTRHDAAMTLFGQWWQRAVRAGHGFAQVGAMHRAYFRRARLRALFWAGLLPAVALLAAALSPWGLVLVGVAYGVSYLRNVKGLRRDGLDGRSAIKQALFMVLSKFPNLQGMVIYYWRRLHDREMRIIEYK
jgi:GT2 family glycosyltransferase